MSRRSRRMARSGGSRCAHTPPSPRAGRAPVSSFRRFAPSSRARCSIAPSSRSARPSPPRVRAYVHALDLEAAVVAAAQGHAAERPAAVVARHQERGHLERARRYPRVIVAPVAAAQVGLELTEQLPAVERAERLLGDRQASPPRSRRVALFPPHGHVEPRLGHATAPDRPAYRACRTPACLGCAATAGSAGTTTSASTNRPPGGERAVTRRNSSAFSAPSRWWTQSALATRSNGPAGSRSWSRPTRSSTRSAGSDCRAPEHRLALVDPDERRVRVARQQPPRGLPGSGSQLEDPRARRRRWPRRARPGAVVQRDVRVGSSPAYVAGSKWNWPPSASRSRSSPPRPRARSSRPPPPRSGAGRRPSTASRAARRRRSRGRRPHGSASGTSSSRRGSAAAGPVRARLEHRPRGRRPAAGTVGTRIPERPRDHRRRRAGTGAPGWAAARHPARASAAPSPPGSARPSSGSAAERSSRSKNITAEGFSSGRRLSTYSRSTANRLSGIAREPVDRVGREHGHAAGRDAALERASRRRSPSAPTTTRSCPARSRRHARPSRETRAVEPAGDRAPPGEPDLERHQRHLRRTIVSSRRIRSRPSGPANSASVRLVARDLGRQLHLLGNVWQVREHRVERPVTPSSRSPPRSRHRAPGAPRSPGRPPARPCSRRCRPRSGPGARP